MQKVRDIPNFIFNDTKDGMDTMAQSINVSGHFHPSGLMYSLGELTTAQKGRIDATLDAETNMLTVMLKADNKYKNDMLTVTATDGESSESISFYVRRNKKPVVPARTPVTGSLTDATNKRSPALNVWVVGTEDEKIVMAKDDSATTFAGIRLAIGRAAGIITAGTNDKRAFFQDDAGNNLAFIAETLSTADSKKLMVTGGDMKVILLGKKTTSPGTGTDGGTALTAAETAIMVHFLANDGDFTSDDSVHVMDVRVDTPPSLRKNAPSIATRLIKLGGTPGSDATVDVSLLEGQFIDDRHGNDDLELYAWSEDDTIAEVSGNPENKKDQMIDGTELTIIPQKAGTTTIMVKAKEPASTDNWNAPGEQMSSDVLVINVTVKE